MHCPLCHSEVTEYRYKGFSECGTCGLFLKEAGAEARYEANYWENVTDPDSKERDLTSASERRNKVKNWLNEELAFLDTLPGGRLLDVGCGLGALFSAVGDQWEMYGVERSAFCVDHIRERYPDVTVYNEDLSAIGFDDGFFDAIELSHVIEHVRDPIPLMRELHRILKPGGWLLIGTPNMAGFVARRFKENFRLLHDRSHVCMYSTDSLKRLLHETGFEPQVTKYPFFKTDYCTLKNLLRLFDTSKMSPPFYGNVMTVFATRR